MRSKLTLLYDKITSVMDSRKWGIVISILFAISLIPVVWVGLYNYASGDDYWYGIHTYRGWQEAGLLGALKGSAQTVAEFYEGWQGTWFTLFLFTLSPNNFCDGGYVVTVFISLACLIGSVAYLGHYYLFRKLDFTRGATAGIVCIVSYLAIQYMPRTTSGLYWFNGVMHYSIPFLLAAVAVVHSHKFLENKKRRDYIIAFLCLTLLGGGSYLAPVVALLAVCLLLICQLRMEWKSDKNEFIIHIKGIVLRYDYRNLWLLAALGAELVGLYISFAAPGNFVRGGEEFAADLKWAVSCIFQAIDRGIYLGEDYFLLNPVTTICYLLLAVLLWSQMWRVDRGRCRFRFPLLFVVYLNGIYWASYTPQIYARSDVSGGVPNTYFHLFLLVTLANMVYVHGWIQTRLMQYWKKKASETGHTYEEIRDASFFYGKKYKKYVMLPAAMLGLLALVAVRYHSLAVGNLFTLPTTNEYCIEYVMSGRAEQYASVRQEQHRILSEDEAEDITVPETVQDQYPLVHMHLSEESDFSRNVDRARYYGKNSVTAVMVE